MRVIAYDPFLSEDKAKVMGVEKVELEDLLLGRFYHSTCASD